MLKKEKILKLEGNDKCADCCSESPSWCALELGIVVCIKCSGVHRSLSLSHVKSISLDNWKNNEISDFLSFEGNDKINKNLEKYPIHAFPKPKYCTNDSYRKEYIEKKYKLKVFQNQDNKFRNLIPDNSPYENFNSPLKTKKAPSFRGNVELSGILQVHLKKGRNFVVKDLSGSSDPYVIIKSGSDEKGTYYPGQTSKSSVKKRNLNPEWNEVLSVSIANIKQDYLYIEVMDWDRVTNDDKMGRKVLKLSEIEFGRDISIKLDHVKKGELILNITHVNLI